MGKWNQCGRTEQRQWMSLWTSSWGLGLVFNLRSYILRATSPTRLRARDHYTLIGGKGIPGPNSLHTTLEGPREYLNARWMQSLHGFLHGTNWIMSYGHLDYLPKSPFEGRPNTQLGDHGTPNAHHRCFILFYHMWGHAWIKFIVSVPRVERPQNCCIFRSYIVEQWNFGVKIIKKIIIIIIKKTRTILLVKTLIRIVKLELALELETRNSD